jgi:hypothetical protein
MLRRLDSLTDDERDLLARATEVLVKVASE